MVKVLVIFADGFEEIEAFAVVDILRRAGIDVTNVGIVSTVVEGAHGIKFIADKRLSEINHESYEMLVLPGGPAYKTLMNNQQLLNMIKEFNEKNKYIAAICAAPVVLSKAGILDNRLAVVYPGLEKEIPKVRDAKLIVDKNIITAKGPGVAMLFAFKLVEILVGKRIAAQLKNRMVVE